MSQYAYNPLRLPEQKLGMSSGDRKRLITEELYRNELLSEDEEENKKKFLSFASLLENTLANQARVEEEKKFEEEQLEMSEGALRFRNQFTEQTPMGIYDQAASQLGFSTRRGTTYLDRSGNIQRGYMNSREAANLSGYMSGGYELMTTNQSVLQSQALIAGSNAFLEKSKAWNKIKDKMTLTEEQQLFYDQTVSRDNNWTRFADMFDSYENFVKAIPVVDPLYTLIAQKTPLEVLMTTVKDPTFNGQELVTAIVQDDPDFAAFLREEGVNFNDLATASNAGHFRFLINSRIQSNALARSMGAFGAVESGFTQAASWTANQVIGTLTSGDFVGQIALTAATAGASTAIAGIAQIGVSGLSGARKVEAVTRTLATVDKISKGINRTRDFLPANIPSTLLQGVPMGPFKAYSWLGLQALEGFVEEGATEFFNQAVGIYSIGTQLEFDFDQIKDAAIVGLFAEPVLGVGLGVATIPINATVTYVSAGIQQSTQSTFNISPTRVREFNAFLDVAMGKSTVELSPEERKARFAQIARVLTLEDAFNRATGGTFGRIEENQELIGILSQLASGLSLSSSGIDSFESITTIGLTVEDISFRFLKMYDYDEETQTLVPKEPSRWYSRSPTGEMVAVGNTRNLTPINLKDNPFFTILTPEQASKQNQVPGPRLSMEGLSFVLIAQTSIVRNSTQSQADRLTDTTLKFITYWYAREFRRNNVDATPEQVQKAVEAFARMDNPEFIRAVENTNRGVESLFVLMGHIEETTTLTSENEITKEDLERISLIEAFEKAEADFEAAEEAARLPAPTAPITPTEVPVAPATPAVPEAPETPVAPAEAPVAPEAPVATEPSTTLDPKMLKQQKDAVGWIVGELTTYFKKGDISELELETIKRRLAKVKTGEDALEFRLWAMKHNNKILARSITGSPALNESWTNINEYAQSMANMALEALNRETTEIAAVPPETTAPSPATPTINLDGLSPEDISLINKFNC